MSMLTHKYKDEQQIYGGRTLAITLKPDEIIDGKPKNYKSGVEYTKEHGDGWTITGTLCEDYYYWVNSFIAVHPEYGEVFGDFEKEVYSDTQEGYDHFIQHHPPNVWDYMDI